MRVLAICTLFLSIASADARALSADRKADAPRVSIRPSVPRGSVVSPGEPMTLDVSVSRDAAVVVFDIDTRGQVHLLHPGDGDAGVPARSRLRVPERGTELVVEGERGMEFVFALATDIDALDMDALEKLRRSDAPGGEPYRIEGDPFLAANTIAGDLVRDVARTGASFGYTYFYVSERVDAPCYLCGPCDEAGADPCAGEELEQDFDTSMPLAYPLRRGYSIDSEVASEDSDDIETDGDNDADAYYDDEDVIVSFYPYGTSVRYVDPYWYGSWWWDPWYACYPGWYPYYPIGHGYGWGWWGWGGYHCSGWYDPWYGSGYPGGAGSYPERFKTKYKGGATGNLASNRVRSAHRDGEMRIGAAGVRSKPITSVTGKHSRGTKPLFPSRAGYAGASNKPGKATYKSRAPRSRMGAGGRATMPRKGYTNGPRIRSQDRRSHPNLAPSRRGGHQEPRMRGAPPRSSGSRSSMHAPASRGTTRSYAPPASRGSSQPVSRPAPRGKGR